MNILYYSAHAVLEDDEVRILQSLGHSVCCLGVNTKHGNSQKYRPDLKFSELEIGLYNLYEELGGNYKAPADSDEYIPDGFAQNFDAIIVMHQFHIIQQNWSKFKGVPVVWRTIGQDIETFDRYLKKFRDDGLLVIRYSPFEMRIDNSLGCDAVIRFSKDPTLYAQWHGSENKALTVVNGFSYRYPQEVAGYRRICDEIDTILGGVTNEDFTNSIGFLSFEEQCELYRKCRAYIYVNGRDIPYPLSFIEAWMTGVPVVVYAPFDMVGRFYEVDTLITHEEDGFVCRSVDEVVTVCSRLFKDRDYAASISVAGRKSAIRLFGLERVTEDWRKFLSRIDKSCCTGPARTDASHVKTSNSGMTEAERRMSILENLTPDEQDWFVERLAPLISQKMIFVPTYLGERSKVHVGSQVSLVNTMFDVTSGEVFIGDFVFFGANACVITGHHDFSLKGVDRHHAIEAAGRDIHIEQGAFIASNATIVGPCVIGKHAVIGAGSVVVGDVHAGWFYAGVPAKPIRCILDVEDRGPNDNI